MSWVSRTGTEAREHRGTVLGVKATGYEGPELGATTRGHGEPNLVWHQDYYIEDQNLESHFKNKVGELKSHWEDTAEQNLLPLMVGTGSELGTTPRRHVGKNWLQHLQDLQYGTRF